MAHPIALAPTSPQLPTPEDNLAGLRQELERAPTDHGAAILDAYELLSTLHRTGTLDVLRGLVGATQEITGIVSSGLNSPEVLRCLRNLAALAKIAASIDPEVLDSFAAEVGRSELATTRERARTPPVSVWTIFKRLCSKDSRRAFDAFTGLLIALGRSLGANRG